MKKKYINKCLLYVPFELRRAFFDRKPRRKVSLCTRTWMYRRGSTDVHSVLMCTVSKMKRRQQTMLSFFSSAEKSRRKTDDSNFRIRANKYYVLFQFWKRPWNNLTYSIHGRSHIHVVYAKAVFLVKCYSLWQHQKVERSLNNKTLQQPECPEFQTNELPIGANRCRKERDCILHISRRKSLYGIITLIPFIDL